MADANENLNGTEATTIDTAPEAVSEAEAVVEDAVLESEVVSEGEKSTETVAESDESEAPTETEAKTEEVAPVVFNTALELPALKEEVAKTLEGYDIPQPVQAVIDALTAKAESMPIAPQFEEYGEPDAIVETLNTHNNLYSQRIENGVPRRNTDKYVEKLTPEVAVDLYRDLSTAKSTKYTGLTLFEEGIADTVALPGDTVGMALKRYKDNISAVVNNAIVPSSDVPSFIPAEVIEAFKTRGVDRRFAISMLDSEEFEGEHATARAEVIQDLIDIQKGINDEKRDQFQRTQDAQKTANDFQTQITETVDSYYGALRTEFFKDLSAKVTFSPDAKLNKVYAMQQVSTFEAAVQPHGEFYRDQWAEAGIKFDYAKVQELDAAIVDAGTALTSARRNVDANGNQLDKVGLKMAESAFALASKNFRDFQDNIIEQQKNLISPKTEEAVKEAAKRIPVKEKAKVAAKGSASEMDHKPTGNPHPFGTYEHRQYNARQLMQVMEEEKKRGNPAYQ